MGMSNSFRNGIILSPLANKLGGSSLTQQNEKKADLVKKMSQIAQKKKAEQAAKKSQECAPKIKSGFGEELLNFFAEQNRNNGIKI